MPEYKFELDLVQQTPMIHFQHDHHGATLRASELKPKLDRFIIKKSGGFDGVYNSPERREWFIEYHSKAKKADVKNKPALNYKIHIFAHGEPKKSDTINSAVELHERKSRMSDSEWRSKRKQITDEITRNRQKIHSLYFANMVSGKSNTYVRDVREQYRETVFYEQKIHIEFICFIPSLLDTIKKYFDEFILVHNFGTRQSKGFGSFVTEGINDDNFKDILDAGGYRYFYADISDIADKTMVCDYNTGFDCAQVVYNILKSGINMTGYDKNNGSYKNKKAYIKGYALRGYIDRYMSENTGSDKAFIKSRVLRGYPHKQSSGEPNQNYQYYTFIRALLGLAAFYEYRDDMRRGKVTIKNYDNTYISGGKVMADRSSVANDLGINRFSSPITVKIFGNKVVFLFNDSYKKILGKVFLMSKDNNFFNKLKKSAQNSKEQQIEIENIRYIKTPAKFDADDFIDGFIEYFENEKSKLCSLGKKKYENIAEIRLIRGGAGR